MKKSVIKAKFRSDIKKIWEVVTDNSNYAWRSDLSINVKINLNNFANILCTKSTNYFYQIF